MPLAKDLHVGQIETYCRVLCLCIWRGWRTARGLKISNCRCEFWLLALIRRNGESTDERDPVPDGSSKHWVAQKDLKEEKEAFTVFGVDWPNLEETEVWRESWRGAAECSGQLQSVNDAAIAARLVFILILKRWKEIWPFDTSKKKK